MIILFCFATPVQEEKPPIPPKRSCSQLLLHRRCCCAPIQGLYSAVLKQLDLSVPRGFIRSCSPKFLPGCDISSVDGPVSSAWKQQFKQMMTRLWEVRQYVLEFSEVAGTVKFFQGSKRASDNFLGELITPWSTFLCATVQLENYKNILDEMSSCFSYRTQYILLS